MYRVCTGVQCTDSLESEGQGMERWTNSQSAETRRYLRITLYVIGKVMMRVMMIVMTCTVIVQSDVTK